jgi:hypothetical protein
MSSDLRRSTTVLASTARACPLSCTVTLLITAER